MNRFSDISDIFVCPVCQLPFSQVESSCETCHNAFKTEVELRSLAPLKKLKKGEAEDDPILKLTPATLQPGNVETKKPLRTELFRNSMIPFFYERILPPIWAMGLRNSGGIEQEETQVKEFFGSELNLVADISCGSGFMARRLAETGWYQQVFALDYSESMLRTLQGYIRSENIPRSQITLIQGDVEALPFQKNSLDAIYSGAAIHCWPDPLKGLTNIYQVLRPGGKCHNLFEAVTKYCVSIFCNPGIKGNLNRIWI
jgi:SAM-dependent methyltransferase